MNGIFRNALVLALAGVLAGSTAALAVDLDASWSDGVRLSSPDGSTKLKIGGRIQQDWILHDGDDELIANIGDELEDGTEFRRLRLYMAGQVNHNTLFKTQIDFAGAEVSIKDAYVGVKGLPGLGQVTVGHQYEPFGLEELTSSKYMTFLERSGTSAFTPGRNSGIVAQNAMNGVNWGIGLFRETDDAGESQGDGEYNVTGRLGVRLQNQDGGRRMVHVGAAGSFRNPPGDNVGFKARPSNHIAPSYVDTGGLMADRVKLAGLEAAIVQGPFSVQGEYMMANLSTLDNMDPSFNAFYVYGSFFLTGEHRKMGSNATFGRVKPNTPYDGKGGAGAWELSARFSKVDLNDENVMGGQLQDFTAGLGWYLNNNFRWYMNYVRAELGDGDGTSNALLGRVQADF
ncbi:MAG: porin [Gemmatimonadetes bacterium]|nr:porin [Gemmatimonadota bacterium]